MIIWPLIHYAHFTVLFPEGKLWVLFYSLIGLSVERSELVYSFSSYPQGVSRTVKRAGLGLFIFMEVVVTSGLFYPVTDGEVISHI